jgi:sucrose-6-phosphate hydrolase SacC (GH32 family)
LSKALSEVDWSVKNRKQRKKGLFDMIEAKLYAEPYRNWFHFSPPVGWLNDINGVWYANGLYHLTYQYNPVGLCCENMHVGHAYSSDLLHWTHTLCALVPGKQFRGAVWSGTGIVDPENRAGFGKDAAVLINTDYARGQCLAVSTDGGWNFTDFPENPVVVIDNPKPGDVPADQRDPKVFWLESAKRWMMIVYWDKDEVSGRSMQFYASEDMRHWNLTQVLRESDVIEDLKQAGADVTRVEEVHYLYECPNMFELRAEGEDDSYWVFHAGDSRYMLGKFEGLHYRVIEAPLEPVSEGPDFYAGQTFYNTEQAIGIYWIGHWNGTTVETTPFRNSATFPTTLRLKRFPEGLRILRNPIDAIEQLYQNTLELPSEVCTVSYTPDGWAAHAFDMTLCFDWTATQAEQIKLSIAEKEYTILPKAGEFVARYHDDNGDGETRVSLGASKQLKLRVLADRDCIEVFFNDGRHSYTEEYGFQQDVLQVSLVGDALFSLRDGLFHSIQNIWF